MNNPFVIGTMPQQLSSDEVELLMQVETATVGHILHGGFVDPAISAVIPGQRVVGTAVTLRIAGADSALIHHVLTLVRPGDFLVIDRSGDRLHACWGGVITHVAKQRELAGGLIDGPATDLADIRRYGMPVWCRGSSPITTKLLGLEGAINVPVSVGGVSVCPGDAVLADESGVVILCRSEVKDIAAQAIAKQEREVKLIERLNAGEILADISGVSKMVLERGTPYISNKA